MPRTKAVPGKQPNEASIVIPKPLPPEQFVSAISQALRPIADPALGPWMYAYMKNQFDFLGIKTPVRRAATSELIRAQKDATAANLLRSARLLWALREREYQYVAVDLLGKHVGALEPKHLPALFALVQMKSWWDTVDALASSVIGRVVLNARPENPEFQSEMDNALQSSNLWVRRVAILHQLGWRDQTDTRRLFTYAISCGHEKEFFIRKAIGWALRDYARHGPGEVRAFLRENCDKLSTLTIREAAKPL